ncbi:MAG: DMT family transporter [Alphaproteobacteria bacterium]
MGMREWTMLVTLSVLWGGSFFFVEVAIKELPPFTTVTLRVALAATALWAFVILTGRPLPRERDVWLAFLGMGILNNAIPFSLITWGQTEIASGLASILNATTPLFTVIVASLLLSDERATSAKLIGVMFGFTGCVLIVGPSAITGLGVGVLAQLAVLAAALAYAFAGVYGRRFQTMGVDPVVTAAGQTTSSALLLLPIAFILEDPLVLPLPGSGTWAAILGLAILSTAIAYVLYFRILASAGATNLLLVTFLIPVSAILLGVVILGENLSLSHIAGLALIAVGLAVIDGRIFHRRQKVGKR